MLNKEQFKELLYLESILTFDFSSGSDSVSDDTSNTHLHNAPSSTFNPFDLNPDIDDQNLISYDKMIDPNAKWSDCDTPEVDFIKRSGLQIGLTYHNGQLTNVDSTTGAPLDAYNILYRPSKNDMISNYISRISSLKFNLNIQAIKNQVEKVTINGITIVKIDKKLNNVILSLIVNVNENIELFSDYIVTKDEFICIDEYYKYFNEIQKITLQSKVKAAVLNELKPKNGIYTCLKETIVYNLMMIPQVIKPNSIIEVINVTEQYIQINFNEKIYNIDKPNYYFFTYYFKKENERL